ncbi:glycine cleavage system protein GcvH [Promethearchaeum syntrophicum]|nr:glycine cleavage system protein H [Candidatus Prometheoarchaeum syntrophicum]
MEFPGDLKYQPTHEWAKIEGDVATVGISAHAQDQLGEIVFVELPSVGDSLEKGAVAANVESSKAVGEVVTPFTGEITAVNENLEDEPEVVNSSPYGDGWIFKIKLSNPSETDGLLDAAGYQGTL